MDPLHGGYQRGHEDPSIETLFQQINALNQLNLDPENVPTNLRIAGHIGELTFDTVDFTNKRFISRGLPEGWTRIANIRFIGFAFFSSLEDNREDLSLASWALLVENDSELPVLVEPRNLATHGLNRTWIYLPREKTVDELEATSPKDWCVPGVRTELYSQEIITNINQPFIFPGFELGANPEQKRLSRVGEYCLKAHVLACSVLLPAIRQLSYQR